MSNELKIGLTVLVAALLVFFGARFLDGSPLWGGGYDIVVEFDDAQGLVPGNPVQMAGVQVGTVREVQLAADGRRVFVTSEIQGGIEIPRGSRITVGGIAALGDVYVDVQTPEGAAAGRPLADGDSLVAAPSSDVFAALTGQASPIFARADTLLATASATIGAAGRLIDATDDDAAATIAQFRFLSAAAVELLIAEQGRIDDTFASLQEAAAAFGRAAAEAEALSSDLRAFSGQGQDSLALALGRLNRTLAVAESGLARAEESFVGLDRVTLGIDSTLIRLNSPNGTLGLLLNDPSLYHNSNGAAAQLQQLLLDFQNNPGRYTRGIVRVF